MPDTETIGKPHPVVMPPSNPMTAAEFAERLERIRERRTDPERIAYINRVFDAAEEYRRQIDEQERRWLDEAEGK